MGASTREGTSLSDNLYNGGEVGVDLSIIIIIVIGVAFCIGGPILGHYATKVSENAHKEKN